MKFACMLCDGLKGIEIYPNFVSTPSRNNICIIAYAGEVPEDVLKFIRKNKGKNIILYLDHAASQTIQQELIDLDVTFMIRDEAIQVVWEVWNYLECLMKEK